MFPCEHSMALCLVHTNKQKYTQSLNNPLAWSGMLFKINYPLVPYVGTFWYLYKDANKMFKPNASKQTFFHVSSQQAGACALSESECASVYCIPGRQDRGDSDLFGILAFSVIKCQAINAGACDNVLEGGSVYANDCAQLTSPCSIGSKMSRFHICLYF